MSKFTSSDILDSYVWRRACKHFAEPEAPIDIQTIIDAIISAPSSLGLTPYKIYIVSDPAVKAELHPACFGQAQIVEASYLLFFVINRNASDMVERYIAASKVDEYSPGLAPVARGFVGTLTKEQATSWIRAQAYIGLGFGLAACAHLRIPSCPMEGFDQVGVGKILNVDADELVCSLLAVGGPTEDEAYAKPYPRFRFPESEIIKKI